MLMTLTVEDIEPAKVEPPSEVGLTKGVWSNALIGINRFRTFYPGLDFDFDVCITQGGYVDYEVALGRVGDYLGSNGPAEIQTS